MKKILLLCLMCCAAYADYIYDLTATLSTNSMVTIEQAPHFYEMYHLVADGEATVTFTNYDANLVSPTDQGQYSDPYLYLYILEELDFSNINSFSRAYVLYDEDDDGNEGVGEDLYFYLADVTFTNELVAMVTSYEPMTTGTVDFTIESDTALTVIPEPVAVGLIVVGGVTLLLSRKRQ
jgi:hypothetical protein